MRRAPIPWVLLACAACSSAPERRAERPFPFHAALLPLEVSARGGAPEVAELEEDDVAEDVALAFDEAVATTRLGEALDGAVFVRASTLPYPDGVARDDFLGWDTSRQDDWWVEAAAAQDADLLVAAVLSFREQVRTDINTAFWLNLPLFLLGGPMTWFVDDRSYFVEAQLSAEVFAVDPLVARYATLSDGRSRLQSVRASTTEVPLDFIDRADHAGHWIASVFVPSGLLATESAEVSRQLREVVLDVLGDGLARDVHAQGEQLLLADRLVDFFLRPEELQVVDVGDGAALRGEVYLQRRSGAAPAMKEARLTWDDGEAVDLLEERVDVEGASRRDRYWRYSFAFPLPAELPEFARLELVDNSSNRFRRTYLLPLRELGTRDADERAGR